jgi:hypothetical protein
LEEVGRGLKRFEEVRSCEVGRCGKMGEEVEFFMVVFDWMWYDERRMQIMEYFERIRIVGKLFLDCLNS